MKDLERQGYETLHFFEGTGQSFLVENGSVATESRKRICGTKYCVRRGEREIVAAVDEPSLAHLQIVVQKRKMGDWSMRTSFRDRLMKMYKSCKRGTIRKRRQQVVETVVFSS